MSPKSAFAANLVVSAIVGVAASFAGMYAFGVVVGYLPTPPRWITLHPNLYVPMLRVVVWLPIVLLSALLINRIVGRRSFGFGVVAGTFGAAALLIQLYESEYARGSPVVSLVTSYWPELALLVGLLPLACALWHRRIARIRIKSVPPGEAPIAIREAWVGLSLPLYRKRSGRYLGSGVLSGPRSNIDRLIHVLTFRFALHEGFVVLSLPAIEILEKSNPDAARWWRANAPHLMRTRRYLLFPTECCECVEGEASDTNVA